MARKKNSLRRSPSDHGTTSGTSTPRAAAPAATATNTASTRSSMHPIERAHGAGQAANGPSEYEQLVSSSSDYKVPTLASPIDWFLGWWRLYEATFAISMLETWESLLLHSVLLVVLYFIYWAASTYLPDHIQVIMDRTRYYWHGTDDFTKW